LILGGSQGARVFSDVVPAAIAMLGQDLRARLDVVQQCRAEDLERVEAHYRSIGVAADLASYFADVPVRLAAAHLVIGRSGASTVAEVAAVGRPALFVPYRHATDDHQFANARGLAEAGGAWIERETKLTAVGLAARLASIMAAPGMLAGMAAAARTQGVADAASRLADLAEALAGHNGDRRARAMPTEKAA
jgi:UDP-N-acetylglucosamine--N-acetylmuramyl-(pentapeptide) pyrophosphoryl-undecaprenol N-acetylglucosamine transferase